MALQGPETDIRRLEQAIGDIAGQARSDDEWGKPSDYLPELAAVDMRQFGIAVVTHDGAVVTGGDADQRFSIQSISKVYSLKLALDAFAERVWQRVGREPSGDPFNSIIDLERHKGIPRNPFINAGALVVIDMLLDTCAGGDAPDFVRERLRALLDGEDIAMNEDILRSEDSSGFANRALANLAKSFDNLHHPVADVHRAYVRQCAIDLSCRQLARAGLHLTVDRADPGAGVDREEAQRCRRINALMLTCGQYDGSGDFAYRVGLPAKSGVGGGILALVPNTAAIAVWSPGLDENGNSLLGTLALEQLAERMDWSIFGAIGHGP